MSITKPRRPQDSAPDLDILGDQVTIHPAGYVEPPSAAHEGQERNLVEHMARFRESPFDFLREVSLHVSGSGWRAYDDVIGQPIFYNGFTDYMKAAVMRTPMLKRRIEELASKRVEVEDGQGLLGETDSRDKRKSKRKSEIEESLQEVAENLTDGMICKLEYKSVIRGAYYVCTQLLTRAYHQGSMGIHISKYLLLRWCTCRYSCLQRGSPAIAFRRGAGCKEKTLHHLFAMPQITCRLCRITDTVLSLRHSSSHSRSRRESQFPCDWPFPSACR